MQIPVLRLTLRFGVIVVLQSGLWAGFYKTNAAEYPEARYILLTSPDQRADPGFISTFFNIARAGSDIFRNVTGNITWSFTKQKNMTYYNIFGNIFTYFTWKKKKKDYWTRQRSALSEGYTSLHVASMHQHTVNACSYTQLTYNPCMGPMFIPLLSPAPLTV